MQLSFQLYEELPKKHKEKIQFYKYAFDTLESIANNLKDSKPISSDQAELLQILKQTETGHLFKISKN